MSRALLCLVLLLYLTGWAWSASAQPAPSAAAAPQGPVIAVALPLSGEYGAIGRQLVDAATLAAAEVGVGLYAVDTEGTPEEAVRALGELASRPDVVAVVGPLGKRESQAAATVAQRAGLPLFALSSDPALDGYGGWVYRLRLSPAEQGAAMAERARRRLELDRVAIAFPQTSYGRDAALGFARRFTELGGTIAAVADYPESTTDFRKPLSALVAQSAYLGSRVKVERWRADRDGYAKLASAPTVDFEALFVPDFHDRVARLLAFLPGAGIQNGDGGEGVGVQLLGLSGWQGKAMEMTGAKAAGALYLDVFAGEWVGGRPEEFSRTFEAATGRKPSDVEAEAFDAVWLLGKLVTARRASFAGPDDLARARVELVRGLPRGRAWTGVCGDLRFGGRGEPLRPMQLMRFDVDGRVAPMP